MLRLLISLNSGSAHPNTATAPAGAGAAQFPEREGKVLVCELGRNTTCYIQHNVSDLDKDLVKLRKEVPVPSRLNSWIASYRGLSINEA